MFINISKELHVIGKICEILDKYIGYENNYRKIKENEYDSQFKEYRDINQEITKKFVNNQLSTLSIHEELQKLNLNNVLMDFDANSVYPSAMWDEKSVYPKIDTGFVFKPHLNSVFAEAFKNQIFNQDDNEI